MATQPDLPGFSYNLAPAPAPAAPRYVNPPAPQIPNVNPGGNITLGEFAGGGARQYPLYDPRGAANVRAALPYQAGYTPGQYGGGSMGVRPALPPASDLPLAVRPNTPPAAGSSMSMTPSPAPAPAMKPAQVLNVRTIPGTGGASAAPMLEAGGAGRAAGAGSRLAGMGSMAGRALPVVGDVLQGAFYGYEGGSVGRGVAAGLGSLGGRVAGAAGGTLVAPGVGTAVGSVGGSMAGAAGAAKLYDMATGADSYVNPAAVRQAEENAANRAVPSEVTMGAPGNGSLSANTGGSAPSMSLQYAVDPATKEAVTTVAPKIERGRPSEVPSAAISPNAPTKLADFQEPTAEEKARFRKETGTPFNPKSINDKLSVERMRAGEETFDTKQANAYRKANPNYRPGQYAKGYNPNAPAAKAPSAPAASAPAASAPSRTNMSMEQFRQRDRELRGMAQQREQGAPAAPKPNLTLDQRGLARTVSTYDPVTGVITRNTSPRPTPEQMGAAAREDYYRRYRNSRS